MVRPSKEVEDYVIAKTFSEQVIKTQFGGGGDNNDNNGASNNNNDGYSYTIVNPGAIGKSKNYGKDPSVPIDIVVDAVLVGATSYYLGGEKSSVLDTIDQIKDEAAKLENLSSSYRKL